MSRSIDERIVDMKFNNAEFEDGIRESLESLETLDKSLNNMDGASKGLDEIGIAAGKLGLDFSALQVMAITALSRITDAALDFAVNTAKSLTIDPVIAGFTKYEEKIGAVQTIMNATGLSVDEVEESLQRLNFFTDETSYSFMDMVNSIGKFTGAGVELDTSVTAMQGIANWAAISGKGIEGANSAMYALSKSMGIGAVKLQDWKMIENANMATIEFKETAIETALAMGTLVEYNDKYYTSLEAAKKGTESAEVSATNFNEALKDGWFTAEVLIEVLSEYGSFADEVFDLVQKEGILASEAIDILSDGTESLGERAFKAAQEAKTFTDALNSVKDAVSTGWMVSFENIIGDYEEAKELWTDVAEALWDVFASGAEARNELLGIWKDLGGRDALIQGVANAFNALFAVLEPIKNAFRNIFPAQTAEGLLDLTKKFEAFTERLIISGETSEKLERIFTGLFAALDIVGMAIKSVIQVATSLLGVFLPIGDGILGVTASLGDYIVALRDAAVDSNIFGKTVEIITSILSRVRNVIEWAADGIRDGILRLKEYFAGFGGIDLGPLKIFSSEVEIAFTPFTFIANFFKKAWETIVAIFEWIAPIVIPIAQRVGAALKEFGSNISEAIKSGDIQGVLDIINAGLIGSILVGLTRFVDGLRTMTANASGVLEGITSILDGVRGSLEAYQSKLKAQALLTIAAAIGILAVALVILSQIDAEDLITALAAITVLFVELSASMIVLGKAMNAVKLGTTAIQMVAVATAILILAKAMKSLADLDWDEISRGGVAVYTLSLILTRSVKALSSNTGPMLKGATGLIALATAIVILGQAVKQIGSLPFDEIGKGLLGVGVLMAEVAGFTHIVKPEKLISTGIAMIAMGAAMKILASAVAQFSRISWEGLAKGVSALGVILAEIAGFSRIIKPEKLVRVGIAMIAMGAALKIFASALNDFAQMNWVELGKGFASLGATLLSIGLFTQILKPERIVSTGIAMIAMGAALKIIASALHSFGSMSWEEIAKGLTVLAGSLGAIAIAVNLMKGALGGAAAMMIMSAAILLLVPSLKLLGSMDLANIGKALLTLVGVFTVIGVAGFLLGPMVPVLLGLAGAIALLGVGALAVGAGLLAFSIALTALSVSGAAGAAALSYLIMTIVELFPRIGVALAEGLLAFIVVINNSIPVIMEAFTNLVRALIEILNELAPDLVDAALDFIQKFLDALLDKLPAMVDTGLDLLIALLEGLSKNIADVVTVALVIIAEFLRGLTEGLPGIAAAAVDLIAAFIIAIGVETPKIIDAGFTMIIEFMHGLATALRQNIPLLVDAMVDVATAMIEGLVAGLWSGVKSVTTASFKLGEVVADSFAESLEIRSPSKVFYEFGENTVDGYVDGIEDNTGKATKAIDSLGDSVIDEAWDIFAIQRDGKSKIFEELGVTNVKSFLSGLESMGDSIKDSFKKVFGADETTLNSMTSIVDEALSTIENRIDSYTSLASDRFSQLSTESDVSVREMISNMRHNQIVIREWADDIATLADRGLTEGLLNELREAGPASAGEVKALVRATDEEIQELNTVMERAGQVATQALATSVGQGAPLLIQPGQSLVDAVAQGLTSADGLNDAMALLISNSKGYAEAQLSAESFQEIGRNIPIGLNQGITRNTSIMSDGITAMSDQIKRLTENAFGIHSPSRVYMDYGENLMEGFEIGIVNNTNLPIDALESMYSQLEEIALNSGRQVSEAAEQGLRFNEDSFGQIGARYAVDFVDAIMSAYESAILAGETMTTGAEEGVETNQTFFGTKGSKYGLDFSNELSNKQTAANIAGKNVSSEAERGIKHNANEFYNAGQAAGQGFINGLRSKIEAAAQAAREMAQAASRAANAALNIRSPSRVFAQIGVYTGLGFVDGLISMTGKVESAAEHMGDSAIIGIKDAIDTIAEFVHDDVESDLTITPVLDLSNIQNGMDSLKKMLSNDSAVVPVVRNASQISNRLSKEFVPDDSGSSTETKANNVYEFTQINNSPKALSRLDIYRQTKNQFAQLKGLVEGV